MRRSREHTRTSHYSPSPPPSPFAAWSIAVMRCDALIGRCRALSHDLRRLLCRSMQPRRSRPRHRGAHDAMPLVCIYAYLLDCRPVEGVLQPTVSTRQGIGVCRRSLNGPSWLPPMSLQQSGSAGHASSLPPVGQHATRNMQRATCNAQHVLPLRKLACCAQTARTDRMRGYALGKHSERSLTR